jgi:hypothetical protein
VAAVFAVLRLNREREKERARYVLELRAERDNLEVQVDRRTRELTHLAQHLQRVREEERGHLARDLHDELGGLLTAAKLDVARVKIDGTIPRPSTAVLRAADGGRVTPEMTRLSRSLKGDLDTIVLKALRREPERQSARRRREGRRGWQRTSLGSLPVRSQPSTMSRPFLMPPGSRRG